ncbi:MAG: fructose-6-phosphate aldolase [Planctomycetes bacterium]|nr:fructose-6-phosphate aldolase [Planctomycetota bacterium]
MKFFLDTASVAEIREGAALGILDGVTTNPSLVAKEKRDFRKILEEICEICEGPVSAEVTEVTCEGMLREGRSLAKIAGNIVVKIPLIKEGIKACRILRGEGIKVNVTLCFSPNQALLAAKAGASYISPFIGRLDDISQEGMQVIQDIRQIYDNYNFPTEILVASIRHPMHVVEAAKIGADVATMPFKVFDQMLAHPLTDAGLKKFLDDWKSTQGK